MVEGEPTFALYEASLQASHEEYLKDEMIAAKAAFEEFINQPRDVTGKVIDTDGKIQGKVCNILKLYENKFASWSSEVKGIAEAAAIEEIFQVNAAKMIEKLNFETSEDGAVFWTGDSFANQRRSIAYAKLKDKKTFEMTRDGRLLNQLRMYDLKNREIADSSIAMIRSYGKAQSKLGDALFDAASRRFAESVRGTVIAVIYRPETAEQEAAYKKSAYYRIEEPILLRREKEGLVVLGKGRVEVSANITLPSLKELLDKVVEDLLFFKSLGKLVCFAEHTVGGELPADTVQPNPEPSHHSPDYRELQWSKALASHKKAKLAWNTALQGANVSSKSVKAIEAAIEAAKDALSEWRHYLENGEESKIQEAKENEAWWLTELRKVKIEPPLKPEEVECVGAIVLPEHTGADAGRLKLRRQIMELGDKNRASELDQEFKLGRIPANKGLGSSKELLKLTAEWKQLALAADKRRREGLGTNQETSVFNNTEELLKAWSIHDERSIRIKQKEEKHIEKEARNSRLAGCYEKDQRRWNARLKTDWFWKACSSIDNLYFSHLHKAEQKSEIWIHEKELILKEKTVLETKLQLSQKEWEDLAEEHPDVVKASTLGDMAKELLKRSDRVFMKLRLNFKEQVFQGNVYLRARRGVPTAEVLIQCQRSLQMKREVLLQQLIERKISVQEFEKQLKQIALQHAQEDVPGFKEAWQVLRKGAGMFHNVRDFLTGIFQTEDSAIAQADHAAAETFFKELQYLDDVKEKWIDELDEMAEHRITAAQAYFENDPLPWIFLSPQERYYYNAPIRRSREAMAAGTIEVAVERLELARKAVRNLNSSFPSSEVEKVNQEKEEAYEHLLVLSKREITAKERLVFRIEQEVQRMDENKSLWFGASIKEREIVMMELAISLSSILELYILRAKQERLAGYEKNALSLQQQEQREKIFEANEKRLVEQYLDWGRLTPSEKIQKINTMTNRYNVASSKTFNLDNRKQEVWKINIRCIKLSYENLKAVQIAESEGNRKIACLWLNSAKEHEEAAALYSQAFDAVLAGNELERERLQSAAELAMQTAKFLGYYAADFLDIAESKGSAESASLLHAKATEYEQAAAFTRQALKAVLEGQKEKGERFQKAAALVGPIAYCLERFAVDFLGTAKEAERKGSTEIACLAQRSSQEYQQAAAFYRRAIEAFVHGEEGEGERCTKAAQDTQQLAACVGLHAVDSLANSKKVASEGKEDIASLWQRSAEEYQQAANFCRQGVEAILMGNEEEEDRFRKAAEVTKQIASCLAGYYDSATDSLSKAQRADSEGETEKALLFATRAKKYQQVADFHRHARIVLFNKDVPIAQCYAHAAEVYAQGNVEAWKRVMEAFEEGLLIVREDCKREWQKKLEEMKRKK